MSLPLLKPLLLTVGATSLVFFGGVIALTVQSSEPISALLAPNSINQDTNLTALSSSLSPFKAGTNPLAQNTAAEQLPIAMLTAAQATALAKQNSPNAILQAAPELVNYSGTVAYEVRLNTDTAYIDANLGTILNPVSTSTTDPLINDYRADDEYEDHDDDDEKHHQEKYEKKRYKDSERLIATSYQQDDEDEDEYDD